MLLLHDDGDDDDDDDNDDGDDECIGCCEQGSGVVWPNPSTGTSVGIVSKPAASILIPAETRSTPGINIYKAVPLDR